MTSPPPRPPRSLPPIATYRLQLRDGLTLDDVRERWLDPLADLGLANAGSDSFGHIHPEDRSRVRKLFMRVLAERRGQRLSYRIIDRHGNVRHIESHSHVVAGDADGAPRILVISWEPRRATGAADGIAQLRAA